MKLTRLLAIHAFVAGSQFIACLAFLTQGRYIEAFASGLAHLGGGIMAVLYLKRIENTEQPEVHP